MAYVNDNLLLQGLSGMFGRSIVFKSMRGKTLISPRPAPPSRQSEQQKANRSKFREATAWAKEAMLDAERKAYYQRKAKKLKLPNAYTAAITDFMRKVKVEKNTSPDGRINYDISKRQFALKNVEVMITHNGVAEIRSAHKDASGSEWYFTLSKEDQQRKVDLRITDAAGLVTIMPG